MKFHAFHGVSEQEKKVGNTFVVNIRLWTDVTIASQTDNLNNTISYAEIYEVIKNEMVRPSNLLEHVTGRILEKIKQSYTAIKEVEVSVSKINPPLGGDVYSAKVYMKA